MDPALKAVVPLKGKVMPLLSLEQRVAALEEELAELKSRQSKAGSSGGVHPRSVM
jgi:hypothetical protein